MVSLLLPLLAVLLMHAGVERALDVAQQCAVFRALRGQLADPASADGVELGL